jgi:hypothetical protein
VRHTRAKSKTWYSTGRKDCAGVCNPRLAAETAQVSVQKLQEKALVKGREGPQRLRPAGGEKRHSNCFCSMASRLSDATFTSSVLERRSTGECDGGTGESKGLPVTGDDAHQWAAPVRPNQRPADGGIGAVLFMISAIMIEALMWGELYFYFEPVPYILSSLLSLFCITTAVRTLMGTAQDFRVPLVSLRRTTATTHSFVVIPSTLLS